MLAVLDAVPTSTERINQEIALRTTLARALMATKGFTPEVEAAFASALERFERGVDVGLQFSVLRGLASLYLFRAQLDKSAEIGEQILALGEAEGDPSMLIDGHLLVGTTLMSFHDLDRGLEHFDRAIALFPPPLKGSRTARVGNDPRVACLTTSAFTLWMLGRADRAAERADAALALAAALDHPFTTAYARYHAGLLRLWRREPDAAHSLATELLDLAGEHEFRIWTAAGTVLRGAARVGLGRVDEGLADVRNGIGLYGELRSPPIFWPFLLFVQARACADAGRPAEGLSAVDRSVDILGARLRRDPPARAVDHERRSDPSPSRPMTTGGGAEAEPWYRRGARSRDRARRADGPAPGGRPGSPGCASRPAIRPRRRPCLARSLDRSPRASRPPMCARRASCSRPSRRPSDRRRALLLVALDDLGRAELRLLGIEAGVAARLALVEQVVAPVELDLDRVQALLVGGAEPPARRGALPELRLLVGEGVDVVQDRAVRHG